MEGENIVKTKSLETLADFGKATLPSAVCVCSGAESQFWSLFRFSFILFCRPWAHEWVLCVCAGIFAHRISSRIQPPAPYHQHKVFYIFLVFICHIALSCCFRCCCCRFYIVWVVSLFFISFFNIFFALWVWSEHAISVVSSFFFIIARLIFHETNYKFYCSCPVKFRFRRCPVRLVLHNYFSLTKCFAWNVYLFADVFHFISCAPYSQQDSQWLE